MLRIRMIEEAIVKKYSEQKMRCPVHLSIGQEAVAVGISELMDKDDIVFSNHRAHAHYLAKNGNLKSMLAEIYGKETGCSFGRGGSMHLIDEANGFLGSIPIVGGSIPIAVGSAFSTYLNKGNEITTIFFGDGATEEGVYSESLNFSSLKGLPILFVCENNFYSVYSPLGVRQSPKRSLIKLAEAHGIPSKRGDGNDVLEVYRLGKWAIETIRSKKTPVFLEFTTYRHKEHCGPNDDDHLNYRDKKEVEYFLNNCPIKKFESQISNLNEITTKISNEISEAFDFAENSNYPSYDPLKEKIYAES